MARAAAPRLSGLRVATKTTRKRSDCVGVRNRRLFYDEQGGECGLVTTSWTNFRSACVSDYNTERGVGSSMLTEGVWAEVKVGGEHLRLFSEHNAQGMQASVYNVTANAWIAPSEPVDDIEDGKDRAAEHARAYLKRIANLELPSLYWKTSRSK